MLRTDYINDEDLEVILALLMPQNRLICQVALHTGLRVGDVVSLRTDQLKSRFTVKESKTGKSRRVSLPADLLRRVKAQSGAVWAFPSPSDRSETGHKTRQAVWADVKRAGKALRVKGNVGTHTMRKVYAVRKFDQTGGDLKAVQKALNHDDQTVTMLYALADVLARQREGQKGKRSRPR